VVLRHFGPVLHRLLGHVSKRSNGLGLFARCRIPILWVSCSMDLYDAKLTCYRFWSKVNSISNTPVNAVWLVVAFCSCLDLIGIGSTLTIVTIFNITAPALDISYIAVIIAHRCYEGRVQFHPGPFTMGKWSKPVNAIAVTWVCFISVVLFFPTVKPVTATNMNYAICVAAFIGLFSMVWWYAGARK
jgi:amino acid transporter